MSTFRFNHIIHDFPKIESNDVFIWVWNANKIPPHLGLSTGKTYLSLTYKGVDQFQTATMIRKIKRSEIPTLFIRLKATLSSNLIDTFQSFERAKPGGATCLSPIKNSLAIGDEVRQLAGLLDLLQSESKIEEVFAVFIPEEYVQLPEYSWQDIVSRIEVLHAER